MLTPGEIKAFIDSDKASELKSAAKLGWRYYKGKHDIKRCRFFFVNDEHKLVEDKLRYNARISHPYFTEIVDQGVEYLLSGKEGFIKSDDPDLQEELNARFNDNMRFIAQSKKMLTSCVATGSGYMYAYKANKGNTSRTEFMAANSMGVVEVRAKETDDQCDYVIYWYVDRLTKDRKPITRIQVWDAQQVTFFVQEADGAIVPDDSMENNPRPHIVYEVAEDGSLTGDDYGTIPFFRCDNNDEREGGLTEALKDNIDDYDLMACGLTNSIQDTNDAYYVAVGYEGQDLDALHLNMKTKRVVGLPEGSSLDIKTVDVPVEARRTKMEIDERNIYRFGQALDVNALKDTNATTNMGIQSAYARLNMKTDGLEIQYKLFLQEILEKIVLPEINAERNTGYTFDDVYFDFQRVTPSNNLENAQVELTEAQKRQTEINTIMGLQTVIDDETFLEWIAEQMEVDAAELKAKAPKPEDEPLYQARDALNSVPVEGGDDGGGR